LALLIVTVAALPVPLTCVRRRVVADSTPWIWQSITTGFD
jgi:hypothetical protein